MCRRLSYIILLAAVAAGLALGPALLVQVQADSAAPNTLTDVQAIVAGGSHTCALTAAGGVKCWGSNEYGRLGDGFTADRAFPVDVAGLTNGVQAIAAGGSHTCALTAAGGVKCWGRNSTGQLGDGTTSDRHAPVDVSGLTGGVRAIAAGGSHTCALTTSGEVKCWGYNGAGQLGAGDLLTRPQPVSVVGLEDAIAVAAGNLHTCALTGNGAVKCWGRNGGGQLGDGSTIDRRTPVDVYGLSSGMSTLSAGTAHSCAVTALHGESGRLQCWGENRSGAIGDGTTGDRLLPVDVAGLDAGAVAVAAGDSFTCARVASNDENAGVKCWGENWKGQLGDDSTIDRLTPVDVAGLNTDIAGIATGANHTCALTSLDAGGGVQCWGDNWKGQLGDGSTSDSTRPVTVIVLRELLHLPIVASDQKASHPR